MEFTELMATIEGVGMVGILIWVIVDTRNQRDKLQAYNDMLVGMYLTPPALPDQQGVRRPVKARVATAAPLGLDRDDTPDT